MTATALIPEWALAWQKSPGDPLLFAHKVLGLPMPGEPANGDTHPLEPWQVKVLSAIRDGETRLSIRAGHGVKKSATLAIVVLWGLLCHGRGVKIPVIAGSQQQLRDTIFPEIKRWANVLPEPLFDQLEFGVERITIKAAPEDAFAVARTASKDNPDAMAGFHAKKLILIIDEASAVAEEAYEIGQGALSTPGALAILAGNPTRTGGFFHATHTRLRDRWWTLRVSSEEVPSARSHIDDIKRMYGGDSNAFRVRVSGEWPTANDETVISLESAEAAIERQVEGTMVKTVAGLDIARFGDDANCLILRRGNKLLRPPIEWRGSDLMATTGRVVNIIRGLDDDETPVEIMVDSIGLGAGVADRLRELGFPARDVNVGEAPSSSDRFMRLRDELWFAGREWFEKRNVSLPKGCERLIAELTAPTYTFSSSGKIIVESKADLKKRGVMSPNQADALLLSLNTIDQPIRMDNIDRHRRWKNSGASPWAA
jgi:phage terminase large subunit